MILKIVGNPDLKSIIDVAWFELSKILNTPGNLSQYLINVFGETEKVLDIKVMITLSIMEEYRGPLIPTPENPSVCFSLPSPEVVIIKTVKGLIDIHISFHTPKSANRKEDYIVLLKIVGHELLHMYLDLEFLRKTFLTISPGMYLVEPSNRLVEIEEAIAEAVSSIIVKNILGNGAVAILSLSKYARSYNSHVLNEVISLEKVPRKFLSMLVKNRDVTPC
jgi:hypothetical protein